MIEVAGAPYDMGYQHGAGHRELVAESMRTWERLLASRPRPVSLETARALALGSLPEAEAYAPELVEEVRGIADGAGFTFEEVFTLNASLDVLGVLGAREYRDEPVGCSTYGVTTPAAANGDVYVGWNADDSAWWLPSCVLIHVRPEDGPPCLTWTFAGFVGRPGLNPHLALGANGLCPSDSGRGVPYPFLCRKALAQRTADDAIRAITSARRLSGMNYMLGDADGEVASLEVTGTKHAIVGPRDGWVAHTNHYVDERVGALECLVDGSPRKANTTARLRRWKELMRERAGQIGMDDLQAMHRDHANAPDSICRHPDAERPAMTLTSLVCLPRRQQMWVAYGPPCDHQFVEYGL
jgi:isopenicillin-N N-acyltransferase-like protein